MTKQNAYLSSNVSTTIGNIFIFANHNSSRGSSNAAIQNVPAMRLYAFKLYDNGVLVRNYVPCYRKSDNVVGLYDTVNNKFYINKGSGTFKYGALLPSEYQPVEYIESDGSISALDYILIHGIKHISMERLLVIITIRRHLELGILVVTEHMDIC